MARPVPCPAASRAVRTRQRGRFDPPGHRVTGNRIGGGATGGQAGGQAEGAHRQEALEALSMAVRQQFGHLGKDAARGLALRHDHGSAFSAEDIQNRIRGLGRALPGSAFVGQPQTNGVIGR